MSKLNFKNCEYKDLALNSHLVEKSIHSPEDAFFVLINNLDIGDLSNLCNLIQKSYNTSISTNLSKEECYVLTQNIKLDKIEKKEIFGLSKTCLKNGLHLGSRTTTDGRNSSSWLSHSLYAGEVCANLAPIFGLNSDVAKTLGMLHDYGRKFDHSFMHTIEGFEALSDLGWHSEALSCLTHSFVKGGRCANADPSIDGFYLDENGNPNFDNKTIKDDITLFLEKYNYTDYDIILNIADLMATDRGIVSPHERIADIATRKKVDPKNRSYFLSEVTNVLIDILKKSNFATDDMIYIKPIEGLSLEEIQNYFNKISEYFFQVYKKISKENKKEFTI